MKSALTTCGTQSLIGEFRENSNYQTLTSILCHLSSLLFNCIVPAYLVMALRAQVGCRGRFRRFSKGRFASAHVIVC